MVAVPVENNLDLRVSYETADASKAGLAFQDNMAVSKAIVAKYPDVREAFSAVIARAVDAGGHDYGSMLQMKDIKYGSGFPLRCASQSGILRFCLIDLG